MDSPFLEQNRPASDKLGISCEEQDGKKNKKERDGSFCKTEKEFKFKNIYIYIIHIVSSGSLYLCTSLDLWTFTNPYFMGPSFL